MSLVSVIVPIYNVEPYLDRCVRSIVEQTFRNLEIILVDDGSPDNCPEMCDGWSEKDSRIKVIHKENGGLPDARNKGLSIATGDCICFIDADDYVSPYLIEKLVQNIKKDGIALCSFRRVFQKESVEAKIESERTFSLELNSIKDITRYREGLFCCGILFPREIIMQEPKILFNAQLKNLEDADWMGIILSRVKHATFVDWDNPMYFYLVREGSITNQCVDRKWQASSWIQVKESIEARSTGNFLWKGSHPKRIIKQMSRHCLKNFYGECFSVQLSLSEIKTLGKRPLSETLLYKAAFLMRGLLRRR